MEQLGPVLYLETLIEQAQLFFTVISATFSSWAISLLVRPSFTRRITSFSRAVKDASFNGRPLAGVRE